MMRGFIVGAVVATVLGFGEVKSADFDGMARMHNEKRQTLGLPALVVHPGLSAAAQDYADFCNRTGGTGHYADGVGPFARIRRRCVVSGWAENVAWVGGDAGVAFRAWWNSGGHRANILTNLPFVGFGQAGRYWVVCFGGVSGSTNVTDAGVGKPGAGVGGGGRPRFIRRRWGR